MPLSEHEQRLLEQMEKALYAEDPKFATSLRSAPGARAARGRAALGVLAIFAGLGLLLAGVATTIIALGVLGFVVMLVGSVIVYSAFGAKPAAEAATPETPSSSQGSAKAPGFMDRMEDRWRRRSEDGQQ
jgi:Flp pilus assembly protein TadB